MKFKLRPKKLKLKTTLCFSSIFLLLILIFVLLSIANQVAYAIVTPNFDKNHKWAWGENIGWNNFQPTNGGVEVADAGLIGYVWAENVGWIKLGDDSGPPYENNASDDWGVNNDSGNLSGYAWGENIGWVNFNPDISSPVKIDSNGHFSGYAWAENVGWIKFDHSQSDYVPWTTWTSGPPTYTLGTGAEQTLNITGYMKVGDGVDELTVTAADTNNPDLNVDGDFTISTDAIFIASSSADFTVDGNWSNSGTFTANGGTVAFEGDSQTFNGTSTTTFYYWDITGSSARTVTFTASTNWAVADNGSMSWSGVSGEILTIVSSSPGTHWNLNVGSTPDFDISYVIVSDSNAGAGIEVDASNGTNSEGPDPNINWNFGVAGITISGTCDQYDQTTDCVDDGANAVSVAVNGVLQGQTDAVVDGSWSITGVSQPSPNATIVVFIDGETTASERATAVTKYNSDGIGNIGGITLYQRHLTIGSDQNTTVANSDMDDYDYSASNNDVDVIYEVDTSFNLTVDNLDNYTDERLRILASNTYRPDSVTGRTNTTTDMQIVGTLTADANAFNISGNWTNSGTFTANSSTVTFNGSSTSAQIITSGGSSFNNVTFNNSSVTDPNINYTGALTIGGNVALSNTSRIASTDNTNFSVTGTINSVDATDRTLTLASGTADISVSGAIGATNDLASLTITGNDITLANIGDGSAGVTGATSVTGNATGTITLTGTTYNTTGTQSYDAGGTTRTIALNENTTFTTTNNTITFTGVVNSQDAENNSVTLNAGSAQVTFNNNVGATQSIGVLTKQGSGDLTFGFSTLTCTGLTLSAGTINNVGTNSGAWTVNGDVTISSGTLKSTTNTLSVSGNWSNSGTFAHSSGTVTFDATTTEKTISDGGSPFYNLQFTGANGGWTYTDGCSTAPNQTTVNAASGVVNFINAKTGTSPIVTDGTLNVDWYLGIRAVNAAETSTPIDTANDGITISENSSPAQSTVWRYNEGVWGNVGTAWESPATSKNTGTNADGNNPQPFYVGAIMIREYQNVGGSYTYYKYNLHIDWTSNYGEYDYYDDYGDVYITSCLAEGDACSQVGGDDDVIGADWHRSAPETMNTVGTVNEPPTNGSWYVGMLAGLSFGIDDFSIDIPELNAGNNFTATATNTLTVTTSATNGYVITAWATHGGAGDPGELKLDGFEIYIDNNNGPGANASPNKWDGKCIDGTPQCGFGYNTDDGTLTGDGGDRFVNDVSCGLDDKCWAAFTDGGSGDPVGDWNKPISNDETTITYKVSTSAIQTPGSYKTTVIYICTANY